jgi:hypothetical protein
MSLVKKTGTNVARVRTPGLTKHGLLGMALLGLRVPFR